MKFSIKLINNRQRAATRNTTKNTTTSAGTMNGDRNLTQMIKTT